MENAQKTPFIEVTNMTSGYGKAEIVKGVNLKVYPGEITIIIGPIVWETYAFENHCRCGSRS